MDKKKKYLLTAGSVLLLVLVIAGCYALYQNLSSRYRPGPSVPPSQTSGDKTDSSPENEKPETVPAPSFTVQDAGGNPVSLSDMEGKPTVINFWATWCGYCVKEMPEFQKIYDEMSDEVNFMMINMTDGQRETVEKASAYVEEQGFTFPVYYDVDQEVAYTYRVTSLPMTYFLDAQGNIVANARGAIDEEVLRTGISMITGAEAEAAETGGEAGN